LYRSKIRREARKAVKTVVDKLRKGKIKIKNDAKVKIPNIKMEKPIQA